MKLKTIFLFLFFNSLLFYSQEKLTLTQCYTLALENHPLQGKSEILQNQTQWELQSLEAQKYPRLDAEVQATYQSDVMLLPISLPNISIEAPEKDQYKATLTASQLIYNGGFIQTQKSLKEAQLATQKTEVEVQLHPLKNQINVLYFNILLLQQKMEILTNSISQLQSKEAEIQKLIATGSTYESAMEPVQVKILELTQQLVEINAQKTQLYDQLGLVIGQKITPNTHLEIPLTLGETQPRSELAWFELQKNNVDLQTELLKKQTFPKVTAFGTAGYGKPGLNMLSNSFDDYYIVGLKAQWNVFDFHANKKQREALLLQKELIENQRQVFEWNVNQTAENYKLEVVKYQTLLQTDVEIIQYRKKIVETADKQLKHDLITTSDYTAEVNKLLEAEINQKTHEILMALAQANYNTTLYE
jgi:outer membrane protein TolC